MSAFKCPKCGKSTSGNDKFCNECGQSLNIKCPGCAETWRFMYDYKFCPSCGFDMRMLDHKHETKKQTVFNTQN